MKKTLILWRGQLKEGINIHAYFSLYVSLLFLWHKLQRYKLKNGQKALNM